MSNSRSSAGIVNFWKLHFQKIGLELKCSFCLNTLDQPMSLPCDHIFCRSCIPNSTDSGSTCIICNCHYVNKDLRSTPHMENILSIYKSMEAAVGTIPFQNAPQVDTTDGQHIGDQNPGNSPNPRTQTSPCSPQSLGETSDSDEDRSDHCGEHSAKKLPTEDAVIKEIEVGKGAKVYGRPNMNGKEDHARKTKRQRLEVGLADGASNGGIHTQPNSLDAENSLRFQSKTRRPLENPLLGAQPSTQYSLHANSDFVCAFCQSSNASEVYGPMLHYNEKGEPVELTERNVIHVHTRCVEWYAIFLLTAPQAFYDGKTVKNLKSEIARAAKLKCNECGLKGASLGCLFGTCKKTFHVPCAVYNAQCRWDTENFHMLCPTHSSRKFPSERSKFKKQHAENHRSTPEIATANQQPGKVWKASPGTAKELIICGSDLSSLEKEMLVKFAEITGATVSNVWHPNITHVIVATDEKGAFCRTKKVLMGILNGIWILSIDWIKACMGAMMNPVEEEPYEVNIDVHGCRDGPKEGRLRIMHKAPKLFDGLNFYFCGYFEHKRDLEELVKDAGGTISKRDDTEPECSTSLVVYSIDFSPECKPKDRDLIRRRRHEEAEEVAFRTQSWVVHHIWILESIASTKLQPFSY